MAADTTHLFLNPTAGRGRAGKRRPRIVEILRSSGMNVEYCETRAARDLEEQILRCVEDGADRIVVAGGDGSVHEAANGLLRASRAAAFGVIPTGTGNDFAKACEIPLNWQHATELLANRIAANQPSRPIDAGKFNDRYFANGAGIGFDAKVTRIAQSIRLPIGDLVYLLAIFKTMVGGIATPSLEIRAGEYCWRGPLTLMQVSNGPWVGGMFHISPAARIDDGAMELLIAEPVTRRRILTLLPKLMDGTHIGEKEIHAQTVSKLQITSEQPLPSQLDGEVQPMQQTFEISVLPDALNLL